jgi:plastocyanin
MLVASIAAAAVLGVLPAGAETAVIKARDSYFTPDFRVLVTGDSARWTVESSQGHTVTSYPGAPRSFDSSPETTDSCTTGGLLPEPTDCLQPGSSYERNFSQPGTYDYYCKIHGDPSERPDPDLNAAAQPCGMCGQIVVKTPSSSRPATRRPAPAQSEQPRAEPSETPDPSPGASPSPSDDPSLDPVANPGTDEGGLSPAMGRLVISVIAIALLSGLGYLVWRRFLGTT